jgi:hypothetical protein
LLEVYQRFRGYSPDDRGSKYLWNVGGVTTQKTAIFRKT